MCKGCDCGSLRWCHRQSACLLLRSYPVQEGRLLLSPAQQSLASLHALGLARAHRGAPWPGLTVEDTSTVVDNASQPPPAKRCRVQLCTASLLTMDALTCNLTNSLTSFACNLLVRMECICSEEGAVAGHQTKLLIATYSYVCTLSVCLQPFRLQAPCLCVCNVCIRSGEVAVWATTAALVCLALSLCVRLSDRHIGRSCVKLAGGSRAVSAASVRQSVIALKSTGHSGRKSRL
jgi:hypothetical protein